MSIVINGSGSISGISVGGLPDSIVDAGTLATNSVDSAELIDGAVDNSHLADNAVGLAEMASGTDGNIISYDASGNPVAIATGSDGQVLTSTGAGSPPAFEALAAASGTVKQIVQHSNATETNISDGNYHVTNTVALSAPASSSSVYLIWAKMQCTIDSGERARYKLTRTDSGGTYDVHVDSNYLFSHDSGNTVRMNAPLVFFLAAPNGLAQTFKLQAQNLSGTISVMEAGNINILTCQEIGAL
jgi:hypothetical protein